MGYGEPHGLIAVPPQSAPAFEPPLDIMALKHGDKVNISGDTRTVDNIVVHGQGGLQVRWQERDWTEAPGPYNSAYFLEAVGAYLEEAA